MVDGDSIDTTPDHPFLTADRGWVEARDLRVGEPVWSADGSTGAVASLTIDEAPAQMWDLTVADAHTFFVGAGAWLVHNCGFNTFDQAKAALGPAGDGMVYDHVVEQSQIVKSGFDPQVVHSAANLRPVPASINAAKAAYYASKQPFSNGLRVRDWLAGQDFATQREFGLDVLRELLNE